MFIFTTSMQCQVLAVAGWKISILTMKSPLTFMYPGRGKKNITKTFINMVNEPWRVRELVMRGEGISTPRIHRTRWEPFRWFGVCLRRFELNCFISYLISTSFPNKTKKRFFIIIEFDGCRSPLLRIPWCNGKLKTHVVLVKNVCVVG